MIYSNVYENTDLLIQIVKLKEVDQLIRKVSQRRLLANKRIFENLIYNQ